MTEVLFALSETQREKNKRTKRKRKGEDHRSMNVAFVIIIRDMLSSFFMSHCMCLLIKDIT